MSPCLAPHLQRGPFPLCVHLVSSVSLCVESLVAAPPRCVLAGAPSPKNAAARRAASTNASGDISSRTSAVPVRLVAARGQADGHPYLRRVERSLVLARDGQLAALAPDRPRVGPFRRGRSHFLE